MKIIKRTEFVKMPEGTLYSSYKPCVFGDLLIKGETLNNGNDWFYQQIVDAVDCNDCGEFVTLLDNSEATGASIKMDFDCQGRDGSFESDDTLFAVWERADVEGLIDRLKATLTVGVAQ